jgi:heme-degrading monooxygenase HmoA
MFRARSFRADLMIVRISSNVVPEASLDLYLEYFRKNEIPNYGAAAGLASFYVLQRSVVAYVELLSISFWESEQVLTRFLDTQTPTRAATESYGVIHLEARNYTLLISGKGGIQTGEDASRE